MSGLQFLILGSNRAMLLIHFQVHKVEMFSSSSTLEIILMLILINMTVLYVFIRLVWTQLGS